MFLNWTHAKAGKDTRAILNEKKTGNPGCSMLIYQPGLCPSMSLETELTHSEKTGCATEACMHASIICTHDVAARIRSMHA